jgi:hypothetical protein
VGATASWLASQQLANGMVPWYAGGHADPWNHTEAAMAMAAGGEWQAAVKAFEWLAVNQLPDGSWCTFYLPDGVVEPRRDPNVCAYVATGAWWCSRLPDGPGDALLEDMWPAVDRALNWCVRQQRPGGELPWSVAPDGTPGLFSLLAACSSAQQSLYNGARMAARLGRERPGWVRAADALAAVVGDSLTPAGRAGRTEGTGTFAPKDRWAMDWYYPVLTGAATGRAATERMVSRWEEFVEPELGTRCVADRAWVTAAETAECAMAAGRAGMAEEAARLLEWTGHLRNDDGAYWTGCAHPQCVRYPGGQLSTYSAAAVVIADHVLARRSPAAEVFAPSGDEQAP